MIRRASTVAASVVLGLVCAALPARADEADAAFGKRMFADAAADKVAYACFVRHYDAAHLAQHPQQKVADMLLLVSAERDAEDKMLNYSFRIGLKYRNRSATYDSSGECSHAKLEAKPGEAQLGCGVDCDGGSASIKLADDNKSVLMSVDMIRIWRANAPDEEASRTLGGGDDRVFLLARTRTADCTSLASDRKEIALMRRLKK
jgi:hypothetical protein